MMPDKLQKSGMKLTLNETWPSAKNAVYIEMDVAEWQKKDAVSYLYQKLYERHLSRAYEEPV